MSLPAGLSALEAALISWIATASGYTSPGQVRFAGQAAAIPATGAFIAVQAQAVQQVGEDWVVRSANPTPSAGAEMLSTLRGMRVLTVRMRAFGGVPGSPTGAGAPEWILHKVVSALGLPSVDAALDAAGASELDHEAVVSLDGLRASGAIAESQAAVTVRFSVTAEAVETSTFIEFIEVTDDTRDTTFEVP